MSLDVKQVLIESLSQIEIVSLINKNVWEREKKIRKEQFIVRPP